MAQNLQPIQDQVNAQMHWDASVEEMETWLREKYSIEGDRAASMILEGLRKKKSEIRKTSLIRMIVALVIAVPLGALAWVGLENEGHLGAKGYVLGSACLACSGYAAKNLWQIISGSSKTAIDA